MTLKNRDIIVFGLQPWDIEIGSNCKNIALEFSKHNRVLYVNKPLDRGTMLRDKNNKIVKKQIEVRNGQRPSLEKIADNLWTFDPNCIVESLNWLKPHVAFKLLNYLNNKKLANSIKEGINELGFENFILFNDNSIYLGYYLKEMLQPSTYIYYIRDNLSKVDYWKYHGGRMEPKLIAKSDLVVNNSKYYADYAAEFNSNSVDIGQGCDYSSFDMEMKVPADLASLPGPKIGYIGHLSHIRLDMRLLEELANRRPDWHFIMVGHQDDVFKNSNLYHIDNIHFLGMKPPEMLPAYIKGFDVCMNPQQVNYITDGNYPRKIDEYLYFAKPTVATKTVAMDMFKDYVFLGDHLDDYEANIEKALAENDAALCQARKAFAETHSWENSVSKIYKALEK